MNAGGVIPISSVDLVVSALLVAAAGIISILLRLRLERQLAVAAVRSVVQLLLIGYVLKLVFAINHPAPLTVALGLMVIAATHAAVGRPTRVFSGMAGAAFITLILTGLLTTFTVTAVVIGVQPWYDPRYVIPLMGMVLGNALTSLSLCYSNLLEELTERRAGVEMELAHGATRWEAARRPVGNAVRHSMIPAINSMMVVGIVSLPGMMTGQILAGVDPMEAVKYQVVVMFMITAASAIAAIIGALLAYRKLFNSKHQLQVALIRRRQSN